LCALHYTLSSQESTRSSVALKKRHKGEDQVGGLNDTVIRRGEGEYGQTDGYDPC